MAVVVIRTPVAAGGRGPLISSGTKVEELCIGRLDTADATAVFNIVGVGCGSCEIERRKEARRQIKCWRRRCSARGLLCVQAKRPCGGKKSDCRSAAEDGVKAIS